MTAEEIKQKLESILYTFDIEFTIEKAKHFTRFIPSNTIFGMNKHDLKEIIEIDIMIHGNGYFFISNDELS